MKLLLILALCFFLCIETITSISSMEEMCAKPNKWLEIYWKCSLRKLPHYYKTLYTNISGCVYDIYGIESKAKGIMYYLCGNSAVKNKVIRCVKDKPKASKKTINWENIYSEKVFKSCTNRANELTK